MLWAGRSGLSPERTYGIQVTAKHQVSEMPMVLRSDSNFAKWASQKDWKAMETFVLKRKEWDDVLEQLASSKGMEPQEKME